MDSHIEELLAFYVLDALADKERELVETYLSEHPEARERVSDLEFAASALPYSVSPARPSARAKDRLMARVAADRGNPSTNRSHRFRPHGARRVYSQSALSMLSLLLAAGALVSMYFMNRQIVLLQGEIKALRGALLAQVETVRQLNLALEQVDARLPQPSQSALTTFTIAGTAARPDAQAQLMTDADSRAAVLVVSGLAPPPPGKTYQIWLIEGQARQSAGFLQVDPSGQGVYILRSDRAIASFDALGVSIEPAAGSSQPTGDVVLRGEF